MAGEGEKRDGNMLALKLEGMSVVIPRRWKRQRNKLSLRVSKRETAEPTP